MGFKVLVTSPPPAPHPIATALLGVKVNNRNTRKKCEICSKVTIKIPE